MQANEPQFWVCTHCATYLQSGSEECDNCGQSLDVSVLEATYQYSRYVVYYGHQYRKYYEGLRGQENKARPSLAFIGDAFAWLGMAVLSGIVGGVSYDVLKTVFIRMRDQARKNAKYDHGCQQLAEMTESEFEEFFSNIYDAHTGFANIPNEVRADILEEITADAVSEDPIIAHQIGKLVLREDPKPRHKKRALELYRMALDKKLAMRKPKANVLTKFWAGIDKS